MTYTPFSLFGDYTFNFENVIGVRNANLKINNSRRSVDTEMKPYSLKIGSAYRVLSAIL